MSILKQKYNDLLKRHNNAEKYMNDPEISVYDKLNWLIMYEVIIEGLGELLDKIVEYSEIEALEGFKMIGE